MWPRRAESRAQSLALGQHNNTATTLLLLLLLVSGMYVCYCCWYTRPVREVSSVCEKGERAREPESAFSQVSVKAHDRENERKNCCARRVCVVTKPSVGGVSGSCVLLLVTSLVS